MTAVDVVGGTGIPSGVYPAETLLGGRFRLDERVSLREVAGSGFRVSVWKATDRLLCRPVTVHLFPPGRSAPRGVVEAVQAAARVSDPRLATVYDTCYGSECPYIVSEWARGTHLEDLVQSGLPSPALAAAMIADAADAIAVAHRAWRPHLCLTPRAMRWDNNCGLKITGLGIDAALRGVDSGDLSADVKALGRMLYTLLTGYWPGPDGFGVLPAAPVYKGRVCTPRQVRAGMPAILDAITYRALHGQAADAPVRALSAAGLAAQLRGIQRPSYLMAAAEPPEEEPPSRRRARHARVSRERRIRSALLHPAA
jgi:serine/threonine protein kinase